MIPILYSRDETSFLSNGICRLPDVTDGYVTEERNGIYECEFKYPVNGSHFDDIQEGRVIAVYHDDTHTIQPFDIYGRSEPINGLVTFYAHHISYRLGKVVLQPFTASSCVQAMGLMAAKSVNTNPFTFWTDKSVNADFAVTEPRTCKDALGGSDGSILDVYGKGDYEWDKYTVKFHANRGVDRDVTIRYGKNLTKLTHETDTSEIYNAVAPYWKSTDLDGDDVLVTLPEWYIASGDNNQLPLGLTDGTWPKIKQYNGIEIRYNYTLSKDANGWISCSGQFYNSDPVAYAGDVDLWDAESLGDYQYINGDAIATIEFDGINPNPFAPAIRIYYYKLEATTTTWAYLDNGVFDNFPSKKSKLFNGSNQIGRISKISLHHTIPSNSSGELNFRFRIKLEKGSEATPYLIPEVVPLDLSDRFDEEPTEAQLRDLATSILEGSDSYTPKETVDVEFEQLWESEEYETYASLQRVNLCDKVDVISTQINLVKIKMEVVKVVYDFVLEKYKSMELGTPRTNFSSAITAATEALMTDLPSKSFLQAAIDYATNLIQGGLGGHVVFNTNANGEPEEILIMDTDDVTTAVNVWRFNLNGLGHSHNGYNGPFSDVALTMDGRINANMITTGIMNANLIRAGVIMDATGNNYWNLDTGELQISALSDDYYTKSETMSAITTAANGVEIISKQYTDSVAIGATNILRGTKNPSIVASSQGTWANGKFRVSGHSGCTTISTVANTPIPEITEVFKIDTTGGSLSETFGFAQNAYKMYGHIGETMVFGAWFKGVAGDTVKLEAYWTNTSGESERGGITSFTLSSSDWEYHSAVSNAVKYNHSSISIGYVYLTPQTIGNSVYVCGPMLEWGNKPSNWAQAPEDIVNTDEIISKINVSPENIVIASNKISLAGKTIDLSTDDIKIQSASGQGTFAIYYDEDEIAIQDQYGHDLLPIHIGGQSPRNYGWIDMGFTTSGVIRIFVGNYRIRISEGGFVIDGPNGSWSPPGI